MLVWRGVACEEFINHMTLTFVPSVQFDAMENGIAITKLMQIFSRQAPMMDALLSYFTEQTRRRREGFDGQPPEYTGHEGIV